MSAITLEEIGRDLIFHEFEWDDYNEAWLKTIVDGHKTYSLLVGLADSKFDLQINLLDVDTMEAEIQITLNLLAVSKAKCLQIILATSQ